MSVPELDADVMNMFRGAGVREHITLLLGAGASVSSGLPDWDQLAVRLLMFSGAVGNEEVARLFVQRQDPLLVAEAAKASVGKVKWPDLLIRALYEEQADIGTSALHRAAAGHAIIAGPDRARIATLNFDTLLEDALSENASGAQVSTRIDGSRADSGHSVHHLHGVITPERAESVVLTLSDFTGLVGDSGPWQLKYVHDSLRMGALLIAGTSYRDLDLRQWLMAALEGRPKGHEALVLLAREGFGLTKEQFQEGKKGLSAQWSAVGIRPVLLHDYADAAQVIRELPHLDDHGYQAPSERAKGLWTALIEEFEIRQREFSDLLQFQAKVAREVLDAPNLNLTLWLSDGAGGLRRWASHDRLYRSPDMLRKVAIGHDSPWLAGKALGQDSILVQDVPETGATTAQWRSVLAAPVVVERPGGPSFSTAAITIGAPGSVDDYDSTTWGPMLGEFAEEWGTRLSNM